MSEDFRIRVSTELERFRDGEFGEGASECCAGLVEQSPHLHNRWRARAAIPRNVGQHRAPLHPQPVWQARPVLKELWQQVRGGRETCRFARVCGVTRRILARKVEGARYITIRRLKKVHPDAAAAKAAKLDPIVSLKPESQAYLDVRCLWLTPQRRNLTSTACTSQGHVFRAFPPTAEDMRPVETRAAKRRAGRAVGRRGDSTAWSYPDPAQMAAQYYAAAAERDAKPEYRAMLRKVRAAWSHCFVGWVEAAANLQCNRSGLCVCCVACSAPKPASLEFRGGAGRCSSGQPGDHRVRPHRVWKVDPGATVHS